MATSAKTNRNRPYFSLEFQVEENLSPGLTGQYPIGLETSFGNIPESSSIVTEA